MRIPPAGWYADPTTVARQRFWDGRQWTGAVAEPAGIPVSVSTVVVQRPAKDWGQRHPCWTALLVFWVACMAWQWQWLPPLLAVVGAAALVVHRRRNRQTRLHADADRQNEFVLRGDERGVYGHFPPAHLN